MKYIYIYIYMMLLNLFFFWIKRRIYLLTKVHNYKYWTLARSAQLQNITHIFYINKIWTFIIFSNIVLVLLSPLCQFIYHTICFTKDMTWKDSPFLVEQHPTIQNQNRKLRCQNTIYYQPIEENLRINFQIYMFIA